MYPKQHIQKCVHHETFHMSSRNYFKLRNGLPDPKGLLSTHLLSQAIALANKEVEKANIEKGLNKMRGQYR